MIDPLHGVYTAVQNVSSIFAERVSEYIEFKPYYDIVAAAEDEYMPGGPPLSPLTRSYFTTWAFFDVRFGPDQETIGSCLLDAGAKLGFEPKVMEAIRCFSESRMGIYERLQSKGGAMPAAGADHRADVRLLRRQRLSRPEGRAVVRPALPPARTRRLSRGFHDALCPLEFHEGGLDGLSEAVVGLVGIAGAKPPVAFHEIWACRRTSGMSSSVEAYANYQFDAIFLTGLPDVPASLPHASKL